MFHYTLLIKILRELTPASKERGKHPIIHIVPTGRDSRVRDST